MKADFILAEFRKPVVAPKWWEGHVIWYKAYPLRGGIGLTTLNLSNHDAGQQKEAPFCPGQPIRVSVGGHWMRGEVYSVGIYRPGWHEIRQPCREEFNPKEAEWCVTVCFPRIPKKHLRYP